MGEGSVSKVAAAAASWFEVKERDDGSEYVSLRDSGEVRRPEGLWSLMFAAHDGGEILPDDYRYRWTRDALEAIAHEASDLSWDGGEGFDGPALEADRAQSLVDDLSIEFGDADSAMPYTSDRLEWLTSHSIRHGYVDQAREETTWPNDAPLMALVGAGIEIERREVFGIVANWVIGAVEAGEVITTAPAPIRLEATSADATSEEATGEEAAIAAARDAIARAQAAADGGSNDDEIAALWEAVETLAPFAGVEVQR